MKTKVLVVLVALVTICVGVSHGQIVLTFDDIPAYLDNNIGDVIRTEYASLGVHFNSDGRHSGIVRLGGPTDPGNWNLTGTNGPHNLLEKRPAAWLS